MAGSTECCSASPSPPREERAGERRGRGEEAFRPPGPSPSLETRLGTTGIRANNPAMGASSLAKRLRRQKTREERQMWQALRAGRFAGFKFPRFSLNREPTRPPLPRPLLPRRRGRTRRRLGCSGRFASLARGRLAPSPREERAGRGLGRGALPPLMVPTQDLRSWRFSLNREPTRPPLPRPLLPRRRGRTRRSARVLGCSGRFASLARRRLAPSLREDRAGRGLGRGATPAFTVPMLDLLSDC